MTAPARPRVALFVTCLVDLLRPSVGFAAVKLLEDAGCIVEVPVQTCCGQPAYNSGDRGTTRDLAERVIEAFRGYDYVVAPSGSCAGMIRTHYPELFADDPNWLPKAYALGARTWELTSFLVDVLGVSVVEAAYDGTVTYHDACSGLRELGVQAQPRRLLASVAGLRLVELEDSDVCCGFGGTFAVKYPDLSTAIVSEKTDRVAASGADTILAGDLGCLMNIAGRLSRQGRAVAVRHVAEVLAGMVDEPPIGAPQPPDGEAPETGRPARPLADRGQRSETMTAKHTATDDTAANDRAPAGDPAHDSPKRHGDKLAVGGAHAAPAAPAPGSAPGDPAHDSPKRQGDKLGHARDAAAGRRDP